MSRPIYYVWRDREALPLIDSAPRTHECCVDLRYSTNAPKSRYGEYDPGGWNHIPLGQFPKEFRLHLLLLGVA